VRKWLSNEKRREVRVLGKEAREVRLAFQCTWLDLVQHLGVLLRKARINVAQSINNSRPFHSLQLHSHSGLDDVRRNFPTFGQNSPFLADEVY
jgi:hypothetical protein